MKICFLDIDGVCNHETWYRKRHAAMEDKSWEKKQYPYDEFCPDNIALLNKLVEATGVKIVISSSWRHGRTLEGLQLLLKEVGFTGEVIDVTPSFMNVKIARTQEEADKAGYTIPRGCEIDWWLDQKKFQRINWSKEEQLKYLEKSEVKNYVILDDDSDMLYNQREHFVKCNAYKRGFDEDCLKKAIEVLNMDLTQLYYQDI